MQLNASTRPVLIHRWGFKRRLNKTFYPFSLYCSGRFAGSSLTHYSGRYLGQDKPCLRSGSAALRCIRCNRYTVRRHHKCARRGRTPGRTAVERAMAQRLPGRRRSHRARTGRPSPQQRLTPPRRCWRRGGAGRS